MNCPDCNQPMTSAHENYGYAASGLPYVTLVGVEVRRCAACGEHEVVIPKIEQLHRTIAMAVVEKRSRLTAAEIRFLRKYLGWSGVDVARHMGVTAESVSRWENDREEMAAVADRLVAVICPCVLSSHCLSPFTFMRPHHCGLSGSAKYRGPDGL